MLLPELMGKYVQLNPHATVNLETDDQSCFYRLFVTIPGAADFFRSACVPALFIDGTFSRIPEYDGCLVPVVAPDGNGGNIPLAAGWVPSENTSGMVYMITMLHKAGFDFNEFPVFTDRGAYTFSSCCSCER